MKFPFFILTFSLTVLPLVYGMNPNEELLKATKIADPEKILEALHNGANVNIQDTIGMTPLHLAAYVGQLYTSSHSIMQKHLELHFKATKILLDAGANVNAQNHDGLTALNLAIMQYNTEIAELITSYLELLKQINSKPTKQLLTQAIDLGFVSLVKLLLKADIKPNLHDLALVKLKYMKSLDNFDKDTYATIGRMLLQHLQLTGKLQADTLEISQSTTLAQWYRWVVSLFWVDNSQKTESLHGPISKSGLGLLENVAHIIASFTY